MSDNPLNPGNLCGKHTGPRQRRDEVIVETRGRKVAELMQRGSTAGKHRETRKEASVPDAKVEGKERQWLQRGGAREEEADRNRRLASAFPSLNTGSEACGLHWPGRKKAGASKTKFGIKKKR